MCDAHLNFRCLDLNLVSSLNSTVDLELNPLLNMNTSVLILSAILLAVYYSIVLVGSKAFKRTALFPTNVDIVGPRKQLWSITRASMRQIFGAIDTLLEGYQNVR